MKQLDDVLEKLVVVEGAVADVSPALDVREHIVCLHQQNITKT